MNSERSSFSSDFGRQRLAPFTIHANNVLMARDDAGLYRGYPVRIGHHASIENIRRTQTVPQGNTWLVGRVLAGSHDAKHLHARPQRSEIHRDVSCAAETFALLGEVHHRNRGFRREPRGGAPQVAIQH